MLKTLLVCKTTTLKVSLLIAKIKKHLKSRRHSLPCAQDTCCPESNHFVPGFACHEAHWVFQVQDWVPSCCELSLVKGLVQGWGPEQALGRDQPQEMGQNGTFHQMCLKGWTSTRLLGETSHSFMEKKHDRMLVLQAI